LLPKRRNAQNLTPLYGFGAILGVFFRYERLHIGGGILTANQSKAAVCRFRVTKKRRIATTLLSCSETVFVLNLVSLRYAASCLYLSFSNSSLTAFPPILNIKSCLPEVSNLVG